MPRVYLPPDADLMMDESPVRVVEGRIVHGTPDHPVDPWSLMSHRPAGGVPTPVKWDPDNARLWYDPDWKALYLLSFGRREDAATVWDIDAYLATGLPLSTRLESRAYGDGAPLIALILQHATWTERWLIGWLQARPDEPLHQDEPPVPCSARKEQAGLLCQALGRAWTEVAEILWTQKGVRFTAAECASGSPITLMARLSWPRNSISPPLPEALVQWRQRAVASWNPPPVGSVLDVACTGFLDEMMARCCSRDPLSSCPTEACRSAADWAAYLEGWVADFQVSGMSTRAVSSWAKSWLDKLVHSPIHFAQLPELHRQQLRAGLEAVALAQSLSPVPTGPVPRSPRM